MIYIKISGETVINIEKRFILIIYPNNWNLYLYIVNDLLFDLI